MEDKYHQYPPPYSVPQPAPHAFPQEPQPAPQVFPQGQQPAYAPPPGHFISMPPQSQSTTINVNTQPTYSGTCPVCHHGKFEGRFTLCGWLCCICCFPIGIICCLCMREKRCDHCGFSPS